MRTRILHVSDIHFGARKARRDPAVGRATTELVERLQPELVIASGDLTHRGRRDQHIGAAALLRELAIPVLAVPGNHDIPHSFPARFTHPWREFEREWETTEPVYSSAGVHAVGVNSARPWHHQSGGVRDAQLGRVVERLGAAPPGALRVVALHHQLIGAPWRTRKRPVARRAAVLAQLTVAGAELIVGGHIHQAAIAEVREFQADEGDTSGVVISIAPGFSQPRPHRLGEARGLVSYAADELRLTVESYSWRGGWELTAARTFPRGSGALTL